MCARAAAAKGKVTAQAAAARDARSAASAVDETPACRRCESNGKPSIPEFDAESPWRNCAPWPGAPEPKVVGEILQRRDRPDPATLIGAGKLEEIAGAAASVDADLLLFDHDLSRFAAAQH